MIIRYYGHSFVSVELSDGKTIAFDPYGEFYHYPKRKISCDLCLISHHHFDHDGVNCIIGDPVIIDKPGYYHPIGHVWINGVQTDHDENGGTLRGKNTFFAVEAENLVIAHAGDLGHVLTSKQLQEIGQVDILFLPVGGFYTIDAQKAETIRKQLHPALTIPIHYRTEYDTEMTIAPLFDYLELTGCRQEPLPFMRVTKADITERNPIEILSILP